MLEITATNDIKRVLCAIPHDGGQWRADITPQDPELVLHFCVEPNLKAVNWQESSPLGKFIQSFFNYYWPVLHSLRLTSSKVLITYCPRYTFWIQILCQLTGTSVKHIAYSFNFHDLPQGAKRFTQSWVFRGVDRFIVHSSAEQKLYSQHFHIPASKIKLQLWGMKTPAFLPEEPLVSGSYICAIGGNARDYKTLFAAIATLPHIKLVVVVRTENLRGLNIPRNVLCFQNTSEDAAMNILYFSAFMVLPLKSAMERCGQITVVAAMHFAKAIVATYSKGLEDYLIDGYNAILCPAKQPEEMANVIAYLNKNLYLADALGKNGLNFAQEECSVESTRQCLYKMLV